MNINISSRVTFHQLHSSSSGRSIKFRRNFMAAQTQTQAVQQKLTIVNKRGEKLVGVLHEAGSTNLVLLCHGFRSSKDDKIMVNVAAALEKEGISAFRFDFSGNGESGGTFQFANYSNEVEDIRSVVDYFIGLDHSTVVVLGHSKGGDAVILYASKYHDIPAVVNISSPSDLKRGMEDRFGKMVWEVLKKDGYLDVKTKTGEVEYRLLEESMMERFNTDMHEACRLIDSRCRVLTVHGSEDEVIPVSDAAAFAKMIKNHRVKIIEGADHGFSSHQDELISAVVPFIKECMQLHEHFTTT